MRSHGELYLYGFPMFSRLAIRLQQICRILRHLQAFI
jgi:hypothetical protein